MRFLLCALLFILTGCENNSFERDKRQLIAKDEVRKQLRNPPGFNIVGFSEDTINSPYSRDRQPIRYSIDFIYTDSSGEQIKKKGEVLFTPDGRSVIATNILDTGM